MLAALLVLALALGEHSLGRVLLGCEFAVDQQLVFHPNREHADEPMHKPGISAYATGMPISQWLLMSNPDHEHDHGHHVRRSLACSRGEPSGYQLTRQQ